MTITIMPWPALLVPGRQTFTLWSNTMAHISPLNRSTDTLELSGPLWKALLRFDNIGPDKVRAYESFIARCRGMAGRFYCGPFHATVPLGVATGTPLINGANQTGASLVTDGWTHGVTGILKEGDYIAFDLGLGRALHLVSADVDSDGSGNATIPIEPPLRASPADNQAIITSTPTAVFRLESDDTGAGEISPPVIGNYDLNIVEIPL